MRHPDVPESLEGWWILHRMFAFDRRGWALVPPDDQERIGLVNAGNGRIEKVRGATGLGIEGVAALDREVDRAVFRKQILQREHLLHRREVAGYGPDPLAVAAGHLRRNRLEGLRP